MDAIITRTEMAAAAEATLTSGHYVPVPIQDLPSSWGEGRAYEDEYGVVGLFTYETTADLIEQWSQAQDLLVELITHHISRDEAKAWDGYLVLLTAGLSDTIAAAEISQIRRDTNRVRKLVATRDEVRSISDIRRSLEGLLPLEPEMSLEASVSAMALLPEILAARGVERELGQQLVLAFEQQESMLSLLLEGVDR